LMTMVLQMYTNHGAPPLARKASEKKLSHPRSWSPLWGDQCHLRAGTVLLTRRHLGT
jgi:hypothetical protein